MPINFLLILIGLIISYESFTLLKDNIKNRNNKKITENRLNLNQKSIKQKNPYYDICVQSIIGFLVGILGGLVGLVLGSIRLPAMIEVLKAEPKIAVGTNVLISSVMGMSGFIGHLINNEVNFLYLIVLGPSAIIGGFVSANYTNRLSPSTFKKLIGIILAIVTAVLFVSLIIGFNILYT